MWDIEDIILPFVAIFVVFLVVGGIFTVSSLVVDGLYKYPVAANKANIHCKMLGYDQYKTFDRIGYMSMEPVAIKCEYSEKYTDLGIRINE